MANKIQFGQSNNPKNRLWLALLAVAAVVAGGWLLVKYFEKSAAPKSSASVARAPGLKALPGSNVSQAYQKAQQESNRQKEERAIKKGGSNVPTIMRPGFMANKGFTEEQPAPSACPKQSVVHVYRPNPANCTLESVRLARQAGVTAQEERCQSCSCPTMRAAGYTAGDMKTAGATVSELKECGFSIDQLLNAGFTAKELQAAGFSKAALEAAGVPAGALGSDCSVSALKVAKAKGESAARLKEEGCDAAALKAAGYTAAELKDAGFSAKQLKAAGFSAKQLASAGFSAKQLADAGFSPAAIASILKNCSEEALKKAHDSGMSAAMLRQAGCSAAALKAAGYTAAELKAAGFSAKQLKNAGFSAAQLKSAGFSAAQLKNAGFSAKQLAEAGFSPKQLAAAGFTAAEIAKASRCSLAALKEARTRGVGAKALKDAGCSAAALKAAGYTAKDLRAAGFSASQLKNAGFSAKQLKDAGFSAQQLASAGFSPKQLAAAGFSPTEIAKIEKDCSPAALERDRQEGVSAQVLKESGCGVAALKAAGYTAAQLKAAGFSAKQLKDAGFSDAQLKKAGFSASQLAAAGVDTGKCPPLQVLVRDHQQGVPASVLKAQGCSAAVLKQAGYTAKQLRNAGFSAKQLKNAGFTAKQLKDAGFTAGQLKSAGFSATQLKNAGFSARALKAAGFSAKQLKDAGFSAKQLKAAGFTAGDLVRAGFQPPAQPEAKQTLGHAATAKHLDTNSLLDDAQPSKKKSVADKLAMLQKSQQARLNQQERANMIAQMQARMMGQSQILLTKWSKFNKQSYEANAVSKVAGQAGGNSRSSRDVRARGRGKYNSLGGRGANDNLNRPLFKAGTIMYGVLETSINSDDKGPIMAQIVDGPLKGTKLLGRFNRHDVTLALKFSKANIPAYSKTIGVQFYAIDPDTARTALSGLVNKHYLLRYGSYFAAEFMSGLGSALVTSGSSQVCTTGSGDSSCSTLYGQLSVAEDILVGLGQTGQALSTRMTGIIDTPPTVKIEKGRGIGLLLMRDLQLPGPLTTSSTRALEILKGDDNG